MSGIGEFLIYKININVYRKLGRFRYSFSGDLIF